MSWSVSASGRSDEVAKTVEEQFESMKASPCPEPEESLKQQARQLLAAGLAAQNPARSVSVSAFGSQSTSGEGEDAIITNTFSVSIS